MTTWDLYNKYQIMPQLATHMMRVAGIGKIVAENWKSKCDIQFTTQLCLVHDLGNIVKFDLSDDVDRSKFGIIENLPYWQQVQKEIWEKYGKEAHDATVGLLKEAGLEKFVSPVVEEEKLYFAEAKEEGLAQATVPTIILMYADCRVTPQGVTSYRERVDDLRDRYGARTKTWYDWTFWFDNWMQQQVNYDLQAISEATVEPLFDELLSYHL